MPYKVYRKQSDNIVTMFIKIVLYLSSNSKQLKKYTWYNKIREVRSAPFVSRRIP